MARLVALAAALVLLLGTATAAAAPKGASSTPSIYQKPQLAIFDEGDEVLGDLPSFDGMMIDVPTTERFGTLIQLRETFVPELVKSCEDL